MGFHVATYSIILFGVRCDSKGLKSWNLYELKKVPNILGHFLCVGRAGILEIPTFPDSVCYFGLIATNFENEIWASLHFFKVGELQLAVLTNSKLITTYFSIE